MLAEALSGGAKGNRTPPKFPVIIFHLINSLQINEFLPGINAREEDASH